MQEMKTLANFEHSSLAILIATRVCVLFAY
jgi:hypothetical protein